MTNRRKFLTRTALAGLGLTFIPSRMRAGIGGRSALADIQVGVIGTGKQAHSLSRVIEEDFDNVRIVAACDVFPAKLKTFVEARAKANVGADAGAEIKTFGDYRELIDLAELDAVVVATPDHQHAPICIAALERGLHVYCEKPLAHTVEEGRAMVEAVERSGKALQVGSMQRSMANFRWAVELIQQGKLGEMQEAIVSIGPPPKPFDLEAQPLPEGVDWSAWIGPSVNRPYHRDLLPPPGHDIWGQWRSYAEFGGGMMTDWGAHMFDIVQWATGHDDTTPTEFTPPAEGEYGLTCTYDNDFRVVHQRFDRGNAIRFVGSEGNIEVGRSFLNSSIKKLIPPKRQRVRDQRLGNGRHFESFFAAARGEGEVSVPAEVGHRTSSFCTLGNIAYRLRRPIQFDPRAERVTNDAEADRLLGPEYRLSLA